MHSDIAELLQRIAYVVVRSYCLTLWLPPNPVEPLIGLPFASCPGWETIKAAAVFFWLHAVVAAEYKTNDYFVRRGSQWRCQLETHRK